MSNHNAHIDRLITRYLTGEASPEEAMQLEQWMNTSPENKKYFGDIRFAHDKTVASHKYIRVNTENAWKKVSSQMDSVYNATNKPITVRFPAYRTKWFQIAASITLIIGLSALFFIFNAKKTQNQQTITITSTNSALQKIFKDNTKVILSSNSTISFTTKSAKEREIILSGEAFIKVNHSADTTLIVHAQETFIKDIGTSFNVKAYPKNNTVEVYVESGEVIFYTQEQKGITLTKGEKGIYDKTKKVFHKEIAETPNLIAYSTKLFIFRNSKLSDVAEALNAVYPETIQLDNPSIADCTITVTFDNESITSIVDIIAETIGLQVYKTENDFHLNGERCLSR